MSTCDETCAECGCHDRFDALAKILNRAWAYCTFFAVMALGAQVALLVVVA